MGRATLCWSLSEGSLVPGATLGLDSKKVRGGGGWEPQEAGDQ